MHPFKERLIVSFGGIVGAFIAGGFGAAAVYFATPSAFLLIFPLIVLTVIATIVGAVIGGNAAGRFIDRNNPRRDD